MTSEIKQRIEQIRRGEMPEGYNRVGIVLSLLTGNSIALANWVKIRTDLTSIARTKGSKYAFLVWETSVTYRYYGI